MIKIFISVRNRLAITKKCIYALKEHSTIKHQIYVYDNETNYRLKEHFDYFQNTALPAVCEQLKKQNPDAKILPWNNRAYCYS